MASSLRDRRSAALAAVLAVALAPRVARGQAPVAECLKASDEGQEQRDAGHYSRAAADFARCSATDCPAMVRHDCARWREDLIAQTPTIVPSAHDAAGNDVVAARVIVDGVEVARQLDGRPIELDPGPHVVAFAGQGGETAEERVVVRAGEKNRIVVVTLGRPAPVAPAGAGDADRPGRGAPVVPLLVGGAAVVTFGVGLYFGLKARSDLSTLEGDACATTRTCNPNDVDAVRSKLVVSDVLIGAAAVGAATSVAFFFLWRSKGDGSTPAALARLGIGPLAGGAQATLHGSF